MLKFNKDTHTYTYEGQIIPSVTQILSDVGIINGTFYTEEAAERGTYVHAVLEAIDRNPGKNVQYDESIQGYVDGWERFKKENGVSFLEIETQAYHPVYRFAGTVDRIAKFPAGLTAILDIKTGIYAKWHPLQTAAYHSCKDAPLRCCVYIGNNGKYSLKMHDNNATRDLEVFINALTVYKFKRR